MTALAFTHRFLPATDPRRPPLLLLHGTGGDENDLLPIAHRVAPGRTILSPRGQVNEQGLTRFFRRSPSRNTSSTSQGRAAEVTLHDQFTFAGDSRSMRRRLVTALGRR